MYGPKTTWGAGEYALMAQALEPASALAVDAVNVSAGERVIDVGTGTGNAALLAAARGAQALGIDSEPALLALARQRTSASLDVRWVEGDAEALPVSDEYADVVLSIFGAMYAADHAAAARELVRVLAAHGRLALTAWTQGSVMPAMGFLHGELGRHEHALGRAAWTMRYASEGSGEECSVTLQRRRVARDRRGLVRDPVHFSLQP
jgi:ubiquinone/menaquinone biosynthesis C-methylase UbiE